MTIYCYDVYCGGIAGGFKVFMNCAKQLIPFTWSGITGVSFELMKINNVKL